MKSALQNKSNKIALMIIGLFILAAAVMAVKTWLDTKADFIISGDEQIQGVGTEVMDTFNADLIEGVGTEVMGVGTEVMQEAQF